LYDRPFVTHIDYFIPITNNKEFRVLNTNIFSGLFYKISYDDSKDHNMFVNIKEILDPDYVYANKKLYLTYNSERHETKSNLQIIDIDDYKITKCIDVATNQKKIQKQLKERYEFISKLKN